MPLSEVFDNFRSCRVCPVVRETSLCPERHPLPVADLLVPDGRLPIHVDNRCAAELVDQRWANAVHLRMVLLADRVEFIECPGQRIPVLVQALRELGQHVVAIDRVALVGEKPAKGLDVLGGGTVRKLVEPREVVAVVLDIGGDGFGQPCTEVANVAEPVVRNPEVRRVVIQEHTEKPKPISSRSPSDNDPLEADWVPITALQRLKSGPVGGGILTRQITDDLPVDLYCDRVGVVPVVSLRLEDRHDRMAHAFLRDASDTPPQHLLIMRLPNDLQGVASAEDDWFSGIRI